MAEAFQAVEHPESPDRAIMRGVVWVSLFVIFGKLIGALKEMVIAWRFGVGVTTDAYLFVFAIVTWPVGVWASIIPPVILPLTAKLRVRDGGGLRKFEAQLLGMTLFAALLLGALFAFGLPAVVRSEWAGLDATTRLLACDIAPWLALALPPGMVTALYAAWTMGAGRHANTLFEAAPSAGILVALLITGTMGALVWGTVVGCLLQLFFLVVTLNRGAWIRPELSLSSPMWRMFGQGMAILMFAQVLMSLTALVDQFFAARFGDGAISVFGYANRVLALALTLGATAVTRATLPVFSRMAVQRDATVHRVILRWVVLALAAGTAAAGIGWWVSPVVVSLLFERGQFTAEHTVAVSEVLRAGFWQVPFYLGALVLASACASAGKYGILLVTGAAGLAVKMGANLLLAGGLGIKALMVSAAIVQLVNLVIFWVLWVRTCKN